MDHRHLYKSVSRRDKTLVDRTAEIQRRQSSRQKLFTEHRPGVEYKDDSTGRLQVSSVTGLGNVRTDTIAAAAKNGHGVAAGVAPTSSQLMRQRKEAYQQRFAEWQRTKKEQQSKVEQKKPPFKTAGPKQPMYATNKPAQPALKKTLPPVLPLPKVVPKITTSIPKRIPLSSAPKHPLPEPKTVRPVSNIPPRNPSTAQRNGLTSTKANTLARPSIRPVVSKPPPTAKINFPISQYKTKTDVATRLDHAQKAKQAIAAKKKQLADRIAERMKAKSTPSRISKQPGLPPRKATIVRPVTRRLVPPVPNPNLLSVPATQFIPEVKPPKKSMEWLHPHRQHSDEQSFDSDGTAVTSTAHKSMKHPRHSDDTSPLCISGILQSMSTYSPIDYEENAEPVAENVDDKLEVDVDEQMEEFASPIEHVDAPIEQMASPVEEVASPEEIVDLDITPLSPRAEEPKNYVEPINYVQTMTPGRRSSLRKEWSRKDSFVPDELVTGAKEVQPKLMAVEHFRRLVDEETKRLADLTDTWSAYKDQHELSSDHLDQIDVAIGQTRLLVGNKFEQFRSLISEAEVGPVGDAKPVLADDLEGFWGMINMQVDNCNQRFAQLEELRAKQWIEDVPEVVVVVKKKASKKTKPKTGKANNAFLEHLKKVRLAHRAGASKKNKSLTSRASSSNKENASPSSRKSIANNEMGSPSSRKSISKRESSSPLSRKSISTQESVPSPQRFPKTPVPSRKSLLSVVLNSEARRSLLPVAGPSATSSPAPRAVARPAVLFTGSQSPSPKKISRKSILKTPGLPKSHRKGVVFADLSDEDGEDQNTVDWKPKKRNHFAVTPIAPKHFFNQSIKEVDDDTDEQTLVSTSPFRVTSIADESLPTIMKSRRQSFYVTPTSVGHMPPAQRRILLESPIPIGPIPLPPEQ